LLVVSFGKALNGIASTFEWFDYSNMWQTNTVNDYLLSVGRLT